ncbi:hypothetical protein AXF42_Ash008334 [Apostasia shenzhenica]|uniref:UTP--glucose-1-phosphate uridylyltransferase 3, chloroplastic n=1 Tax=Apostasia shenzhenica TaxID=1088818 RepID=A0A2I0AXK7_9ASPA|nr:hypothetical protein AXF42_Ash008334 [Apostasia shenzhenica]
MAIETASSATLSRPSLFIPQVPSLPFTFQRGNVSFCRQLSSFSYQSLSSSSAATSSSRTYRVATTTVEQAPAPGFDFEEEIARLDALRTRLRDACTLRGKLRVLNADARVKDFFGSGRALASLDLTEEFLLKCLVAAGQGHVLGSALDDCSGGHHVAWRGLKDAFCKLADVIEKCNLDGFGVEVEQVDGRGCSGNEPLKELLKTLDEVEKFYDCIGGIIGYQVKVLELLLPLASNGRNTQSSILNKSLKRQLQEFYVPAGVNLLENAEYASQAAFWGVEGLPELGEIYPLGGAGDRLGLVDPMTGACLPAAMLPYCGRTLLEGLIRDLQAREFLHFKIFGKQCITPVAIMTSSIKNNHDHISTLCENHGWFARGRQNFKLFEQPMVPVVAAEDGQWLISGPLSIVCKPGGHGALWKLAYDKGVFQCNVVAATDVTMLALAGIGLRHDKRNLGATEGINVFVEKESEDGRWRYGLTCIEYTEFEKYGNKDVPDSLGRYPLVCEIIYENSIVADIV